MPRQSPSNGPAPFSSVDWAACRRAIATPGRAACRYLGRLWPLVVLGAASAAIILTSDAPLVHVAVVALGTLGIAIGARFSSLFTVSVSSGRAPIRMRDPRIILWTLGAALHLLLLIRVLTEPTNGYDIALWAAGIASFGASFVSLDTLRDIRFRPPLVDTAIIAALVIACLAIHAHDLRDWRYAAIGDEIGFFMRVRQILEEGIRHPFALNGVYHNSPMLNSVYQASVSWLFGGSAWGWKFSSVLSVALAAPAIYWLACIFAGRIAGIIASGTLIFSHYLMAFTHTGYTHLDALPLTAWAVLAFIIGNNRKSAILLFAAGVIAGLGLYTALPARIILPLFAAWLISGRASLQHLTSLWPVALGFALCALPFIAHNGGDAISIMSVDLISTNTIHGSLISNPSDRLMTNLANNMIAWWWNPHMSHYTSGSLLDMASGLLAILGIGIAVGKWRTSDKFLIAWLAMSMFATAILSPYPFVPITRMHANLLPIALLSGVAFHACVDWIRGYQAYKYLAVAALLALIATLNLWRFHVTTPNALPHYTQESLAVKAWQSDECGRDEDTLFIGRDGHLMDLVLLTYTPEGERPKVVEYEDPLALQPRHACKIFFRPDDLEAQRILQVLAETSAKQPTIVSNPSGHTRVEVMR